MSTNRQLSAPSHPVKHLLPAAGCRINSATRNLAKEQDFSLFSLQQQVNWWQMLWDGLLLYFVDSCSVQCFELWIYFFFLLVQLGTLFLNATNFINGMLVGFWLFFLCLFLVSRLILKYTYFGTPHFSRVSVSAYELSGQIKKLLLNLSVLLIIFVTESDFLKISWL